MIVQGLQLFSVAPEWASLYEPTTAMGIVIAAAAATVNNNLARIITAQ